MVGAVSVAAVFEVPLEDADFEALEVIVVNVDPPVEIVLAVAEVEEAAAVLVLTRLLTPMIVCATP